MRWNFFFKFNSFNANLCEKIAGIFQLVNASCRWSYIILAKFSARAAIATIAEIKEPFLKINESDASLPSATATKILNPLQQKQQFAQREGVHYYAARLAVSEAALVLYVLLRLELPRVMFSKKC